MKLLTYYYLDDEAIGVLTSDEKRIIPLSIFGFSHKTMNEFICGTTPQTLKGIHEQMLSIPTEKGILFEDIKLLAPIPMPRQDIICLGINYLKHEEEAAKFSAKDFATKQEAPIYFSKRVSRATNPYEEIPSHKKIVDSLDYEAELAIIIGKETRNVNREDVHEHIFGYTIINDMTARTQQTRHKQWYFGKSMDGFTPMGPWIVTSDELTFPPSLRISCSVNGELRQNSNTNQLVFDIPHIISELSSGMTLLPGTIIATGTPAGVGMGFTPPRFLESGDEVICTIEGIGTLKNRIK